MADNYDIINPIELRLNTIKQIFNSMDPSPFLERELDQDASEYIISTVKEHSKRRKHKIIIHLQKKESKKTPESQVRWAIKNHFLYKKEVQRKYVNQKIIEGQKSLTIALTVLFICLFGRQWILHFSENVYTNVFAEALIIIGWVAMWKPVSDILYEWVPLKKEMKLYEKISIMPVEFVYE